MIDIIFENIYYKICIALIISLLLTFSHEIKLLKEYWVLIIIAFICLLSFSTGDIGIVLLMIALLAITFNIQLKINKNLN